MSNAEMPPQQHLPVLLEAVVTWLAPRQAAVLLDGTLGNGGHSRAWLAASAPDGRVIGFDKDPAALEHARARLAEFGDRLTTVHASYGELAVRLRLLGVEEVDAVLLDLGYSSAQIDDPARGFSFRADGPLDMRYDPAGGGQTAADLLNSLSEAALADLIFHYGEERYARRIAARIVRGRPLRTTAQLAEVVRAALPPSRARIHPATRTFQALRIAVNNELATLTEALPQALALLRPAGRIGVISFHSLEDRIVKTYFRQESRDCLCPSEQPVCTCGHVATLEVLTRKPVTPSPAEIEANPRARSAKLRAARRL